MNSDSISRGSACPERSSHARPLRTRRRLASCEGQVLCLALFAAMAFAAPEAHAQAGDKPAGNVQVISVARPVWLLEQPPASGLMLSARTYGESAYGDYKGNATLAIGCHPQNPVAGLSLQIAPSTLGFDSDPFEGPDATAAGPLRITTGTRAAVTHPVSGIWTDGGAFQVGNVFAINASIPRDELAYWASDASRGQPLKLSLAPAKAGGRPLTATFSLPQDSEGLKKVIQPCVDAAAATAAKP